MNDPYFFGYGSLVNAATHVYTSTHPAQLRGWRRIWRHTGYGPYAFLSATPAQGSQIDGLIAKVPDADWAALDIREAGYFRSELAQDALTHGAGEVGVQIYQTHADKPLKDGGRNRILLSYLDVVVQGFLQVFGEDGAHRFFQTTDNWDAPILNDRSAPLYPRSKVLSAQQTAFVDDQLKALNAQIIQP